ncbi:lysylphosphatidylglycerol synthase transmembrane domain-containing protein [Candidatus Dactylopiibacterium carminicum]|uniref:lysylphosphatidylglycerol synthase transmembrane domain-containing protein n=1 Tax=Candidatus Dactylopiibacterium carminicum TaxID=857335 RepID=UPI001CC30443|nr:YbhN family protein [Candidatus Dactylopiibacterium carminicum]
MPSPEEHTASSGTLPGLIYRLLSLFERRRALLMVVVVAALAAFLLTQLRHLTGDLRYADLVTALTATPVSSLVAAFAATVVSYVALTGYDVSALRYAGAKLPYRVVGPTAFVAYALGNNIGLGMLTGGAVRMRVYTAAGIEAGRVMRASPSMAWLSASASTAWARWPCSGAHRPSPIISSGQSGCCRGWPA